MTWEGLLMDTVLRSGNKHNNHGRGTERMIRSFAKLLISLVVRERGVEPLREIPLDPKSSASTSSATLAQVGDKLVFFMVL